VFKFGQIVSLFSERTTNTDILFSFTYTVCRRLKMSPYKVGNDRILRDNNGNTIGKVGYDNQVRDSYHDRGKINSDGKYIDQYGRDLGYSVRDTGSSIDYEAIGTGIGLLIAGAAALVSWLSGQKDKGHERSIQTNISVDVKEPLPKNNITLSLTPEVSLELIYIPAGEFLMGNEKRSNWIFPVDSEAPEHHVYLPGYWISRHPITVQHFLAFVQLSGHKVDLVERRRSGEESSWPVTNVSWPDAVAFCTWASVATGHLIRLPTEAEWEKAARGVDGRLYPWGNNYDQSKCNGGWKGYGHPTPVGMFSPQGDSPYGCTDMAGNVEEWTSSRYGRYPYQSDDGREDPRPYGHGVREVRGGSYNKNNPSNVSVVRRDGYGEIPWGHWETVGFRCVCAQ
jgi:formylglycine-generating enzyme required for sulfatase activity